MEEMKSMQKEAAVAADVMNNVEGAAVPATSEEPEAVKAASLLDKALDKTEGARSRQGETFGRHWSGTQSLAVLKKGALETLAEMETHKANLEALLQEIEQKEAADYFAEVTANAAKLSPAEKAKIIAALQGEGEKVA